MQGRHSFRTCRCMLKKWVIHKSDLTDCFTVSVKRKACHKQIVKKKWGGSLATEKPVGFSDLKCSKKF